MSQREFTGRIAAMRRALELVTEALDLIDAYNGPPTSDAHLALVQELLRQDIQNGNVTQPL